MNRRKRIALATLPAIALLVLGSSVAYAHMGRLAELTEEEKSALLEARALREEGDIEGARERLLEAGFDPTKRFFGKRGHHRSWDEDEHRAHHEAVRTALENNDYEAFKTAVADAPFSKDISEEAFKILVEAHALKKAGDFEGAHALLKEAGILGWGNREARGGPKVE